MELKTWLEKIQDSTMLRRLTIVGTNNSCSFKYNNFLLQSLYKTQNKTIKEQLCMGVRFLDVTLIKKGVNCFIKCGTKLIDIKKGLLNECESFLSEHPTEFILLNIRADYDCTKIFMRQYASIINSNDFYSMSTNSDITVGELRGKILMLNLINSNEYIENMRSRVNYNDKYGSSIEESLLKYTEVVSFDLESQEQDKRLYVNFSNTKGYVLKYIPQPKCSAKKINGMIKSCFSKLQMRDVILVVDYIDEELSKIITKNNFLVETPKM